MPSWHLAQINIARLVAPQGDPRVQEFFDQLDSINALAETSSGFVWRLQSDGGNATDIMTTIDPRLIVNMSVWRDADALFNFVYRSAHTPVMGRRREWFERYDGAYQALWWIPAGHRPTTDEAFARLWHLEHFGPTPHSFTFKARYSAPDASDPDPVDMKPDPWCVGRA